jgi:Fe-S oxidoreductase
MDKAEMTATVQAGAVTWHDSCHIGRAGGVYEPPRDVIKAIPGVELVEMEHNREDGLCCGSVLTLQDSPPGAAKIGNVKLEEARATGADTILALCPCCEFQMRVTKNTKGNNIRYATWHPLPVKV